MKNFQEFNEGYLDDLKSRFKKKVEIKTGEKLRNTYDPEMLWKFQPKIEKVVNTSTNRGRCFYVACAVDTFQWRIHPSNPIPSARIKEKTESFKSKFERGYFDRDPEYKLGRICVNSESQGIGKWLNSSRIEIDEKANSLYVMKISPYFDELKNKANLLNLKIGEQIHIKTIDKLESITNIKEVCFTQVLRTSDEITEGKITYNGVICDLALFFETPSGIWSPYQIEPLNQDQYNRKMKIDGIDILYQGLIDLRDEGKIDFSFEHGKCKTGDFYTCTVTTNFTGVNGNKFFIEFMKDYETMCDRLSEDGYEVCLMEMNHTKIKFTVKHT